MLHDRTISAYKLSVNYVLLELMRDRPNRFHTSPPLRCFQELRHVLIIGNASRKIAQRQKHVWWSSLTEHNETRPAVKLDGICDETCALVSLDGKFNEHATRIGLDRS